MDCSLAVEISPINITTHLSGTRYCLTLLNRSILILASSVSPYLALALLVSLAKVSNLSSGCCSASFFVAALVVPFALAAPGEMISHTAAL